MSDVTGKKIGVYKKIQSGVKNEDIVSYDESILRFLATHKIDSIPAISDKKFSEIIKRIELSKSVNEIEQLINESYSEPVYLKNDLLTEINRNGNLGRGELFARIIALAFPSDITICKGQTDVGICTWLEDEKHVYDPIFVGKYPKELWYSIFHGKDVEMHLASEDLFCKLLSNELKPVKSDDEIYIIKWVDWYDYYTVQVPLMMPAIFMCNGDCGAIPIIPKPFPYYEKIERWMDFKGELKNRIIDKKANPQDVPQEIFSFEFYLYYSERVDDYYEDKDTKERIVCEVLENPNRWEYFKSTSDTSLARTNYSSHPGFYRIMSSLSDFYKEYQTSQIQKVID